MASGRYTTNKAKIQYYCARCQKDVHLYGSTKHKSGHRVCNHCGYLVFRKVL